MPFIVCGERWRRDVVTAAPDLHLVLAVFRGGLRLVQSLKRAVVTLVETPALFDWKPHLVELVEGDPECPDRALEHGHVGLVEDVPAFLQQTAGGGGFLAAAVGEIDIGPAGEAVLP